ncbi:nitronate monooxygenase [Streptomyces sp. NPDC003656]
MPRALADLLTLPIVQAPMAGGVSTPELATAVCEAGALGFLAGGYRAPDALRADIERLRGLTDRPFGVNLFLPQWQTADPAAVEAYARGLAGESARYGTATGDPYGPVDDAYDAKLALLLADPVPVVSFHFGVPEPEVLDALRRAGTVTLVTATTAEEARAVERAGAAAVIAQGIEAGGHQGTHRDDPARDRAGLGLLALLAQVTESVDLPVVAAGGIMRGAQIAAVLAAGASAAQLGTAFLATPESGAPDPHKRALTDPGFPHTEPTRAFTGRPARALVNRFLREHGADAPAAYPAVHHLTAPLRRVAAGTGDTQGMALWAGQGHRLARALPAGRLVEVLAAELRAATTELADGGGAG